MELRTILQSLRGGRLKGGNRGLSLYKQFETTSQLLCCSKQGVIRGTASLPHGLFLPSLRSGTQLGRPEDRPIPIPVSAQAACGDLPQLHGPCGQDNLHQPQKQGKEHRHFCLSSKHLLNKQAGNHSQFAEQGETLEPRAGFLVQHSWNQPRQKQTYGEGQEQMVCHVMALCAPHAVPEPGRAAGLER